MSAERDELADDLADSIFRYTGVTTSSSKSMADELLAAGYKKPRTITTVEELDALPLCSIVMNNGSNPHAWQKRTDIHVGDAWYLTSDTDYGMDSYAIFEDGDTATVLYEPQP